MYITIQTVWPDLQTALLNELQIDNITNLIHDKIEILAIIFLPHYQSITDSKFCTIRPVQIDVISDMFISL
jgi:CRISPR/Cas system endoribonuclease Cas6 (RAMP superfamily)